MRPIFRFAPSPNGRLHLGHAYSALLNTAIAERLGGRLLLRIEDIDLQRARPELVAAIEDDLAWLGLRFEAAPWRQSERFPAYAEALAGLRARGLVYPCFCSRGQIAARIAALAAAGQPIPRDPDGTPLYPGTCRALPPADIAARQAAGEIPAWRLDMARALAAEPGAYRYRRFDVSLYSAASPPPCGEGSGVGVAPLGRSEAGGTTPTSHSSPPRSGLPDLGRQGADLGQARDPWGGEPRELFVMEDRAWQAGTGPIAARPASGERSRSEGEGACPDQAPDPPPHLRLPPGSLPRQGGREPSPRKRGEDDALPSVDVPADPARWGDVVLARRDTPASYHLAVVIDDAAQRVTHVVRGQDLEAATDLHVLLQRLFCLPSPLYHHHALIRAPGGEKLAKSRGSESLADLRARGVVPEEVRARLGFVPGEP